MGRVRFRTELTLNQARPSESNSTRFWTPLQFHKVSKNGPYYIIGALSLLVLNFQKMNQKSITLYVEVVHQRINHFVIVYIIQQDLKMKN